MVKWIALPQKLGRSLRSHLLRLAAYAHLPAAWLRRGRSFVRSVHPGHRTLEGAVKAALFVHFDRRGTVDDYVLFYLEALRRTGFEIVLIANGPDLTAHAMLRVLPLCAHVVWRDNIGYDFGAYRDGLTLLGDLSRFEAVVLANDSVYGPLFDLGQTLAGCDPATPVWGITDSWNLRYHLQSYFLLLQGDALRNDCVPRFFNSVLPTRSKVWVVRHYEIGFTQAMLRGGLRCSSLFPYRQAAAALGQAELDGRLSVQRLGAGMRSFFVRLLAKIENGKPLNPMHHFWDYMICTMRCPFLKRELLTRNPAEIPHVYLWEQVIRDVSEYDTNLIVRHLQGAVARDRAP